MNIFKSAFTSIYYSLLFVPLGIYGSGGRWSALPSMLIGVAVGALGMAALRTFLKRRHAGDR